MKYSAARQVKRRDEIFAEKTQTKIWLEKATEDNPFVAESVYCHGYELFDLMENSDFVEVLYLLYKGELPTLEMREMLEKLMIGLLNPGPRHAATRAAMNAGVGKTHPVHILPIASIVMGGERDCAGAIEPCMRFFRKHFRKDAALVANEWRHQEICDWEMLPGFGSYYGGIDVHAQKLADYLLTLPAAGDILRWGNQLAENLQQSTAGWLKIGVAAAVFADLGFHPKLGGALFQLFSAPGLIAHGFELSTKPLTAMPYVKDENYVIKSKC